MPNDLVFSQAPLTESPINLVFGDDGGPPPVSDAVVSFVTSLPPLSGAVRVAIAKGVSLNGALPALGGSVVLRYESNTARPLVNQTRTQWQDGISTDAGVQAHWQDTDRLPVGVETHWQDGIGVRVGVGQRWQDAVQLRNGRAVRYQDATPVDKAVLTLRYQDAARLRRGQDVRFQEAIRTDVPATGVRYQDALRDRRNSAAVRFQQAVPVSKQLTTAESRAQALNKRWDVRYQEAMPPPPGIWVKPGPEPEEPCYVPPPGSAVPLLFIEQWTGSPNLLFVCERHGPGVQPGETVVVPVKEVYLVINSAVLIRVDNGQAIPTFGMSMSLDVDSWTWSFSASVPGRALNDIRPVDGVPVDVQATINGVAYRFIVESISRDREFGKDALRVSGRGRAAALDTPYAPVQDFRNGSSRTAQQLMGDILTDNGVPLGWDVEWNPTDWLVPAGAFSHQGSYVSALNSIAGSIGAYIQPHNTNEMLRVLSRYPSAPWEWGSITPDYELPSAVVTSEGMTWTNKALYNRVYVSGQGGGVLGRVTRAGTAGDLLAPSVIDSLITHADAARQRGIAILSDTGNVVSVSLRLPVLAETGIIQPGKFVKYTDAGTERIGITRSVSVDVNLPTVWQVLSVESRDEPV